MSRLPPEGPDATPLTPTGEATAQVLRTMRRGVVLNGVGWLLPALLALASVPALTRALGAERFGLLTLAWAAVAAFGALDLGVGRAVAFLVADYGARGARAELPPVLAAANWSVWILFTPFALLGAVLAPWLVASAFDIPTQLHAEGTRVLRLLAIALPFVVHGIVLRSAFEGDQRWRAVNALRIPLGVVTWGGPWLALAFTRDVSALAGVIVAGRVGYWLAQLLWLRASWRAPDFGTLMRAGGWMTVSGLVSPVLVMADRALLPLVAPIAVVGWYVAAGEGATKLWLFPTALVPVLFPALTAAIAGRRASEAAATPSTSASDASFGELMSRATRATGAVLLPVSVLLVLLAEPLLQWWLAAAYAPEVVEVFRLFVTAIYLNSIALVAYTALQAAGQAGAAARLHLLELPIFAFAMVMAAKFGGVMGIALVWALRLMLDGAAMWRLALRRLPGAEFAAEAAMRWGLGGAAMFGGLAVVRWMAG